jgi:geranylgeranyl diphosphate synthase, type II
MHTRDIFQERLEELRRKIKSELLNLPAADSIPLFYEPIHYINRLPGKKIRPLLTVISGLAVGGNTEHLIFPAAAIELLHNFSLVHDDIMDEDHTRRGQPTVHIKWDIGTAILAGDGLLGLAYRKLLQTPNIRTNRLTTLFTEAMLEICEGQALDKSFETVDEVNEKSYIEMIARKTARLMQLACEMGAIVGQGTSAEIRALAKFGFNLGMGFQIQDDLLDIFADEDKLGKPLGSDLNKNKKTITSIKLYSCSGITNLYQYQLAEIRQLLDKYGIIHDVNRIAESYFSKAYAQLNKITGTEFKQLLIYLLDFIKNREM